MCRLLAYHKRWVRPQHKLLLRMISVSSMELFIYNYIMLFFLNRNSSILATECIQICNLFRSANSEPVLNETFFTGNMGFGLIPKLIFPFINVSFRTGSDFAERNARRLFPMICLPESTHISCIVKNKNM